MYYLVLRTVTFITIVFYVSSCTTGFRMKQANANINSIKYINTYSIPFDLTFKNTVVGGLSGIDYDRKHDLFYLISDDRGEKNPARFYVAKIILQSTGIERLQFIEVQYFLQPDGQVYPGNKKDRPDPESIRMNAKTGLLAWSSEGERTFEKKDTFLTDPAIITIDLQGKYRSRFTLPDNLKMQTIEKGPRKNGALEGLCFADNFKTLFVNVEEPLYEDGPRADVVDNNAFIRIFKFNVAEEVCKNQYAYKLEPVAYEANPASEFKINGVPEILGLGNNSLLVIERSFSTGRIPCSIKIFKADLNEATDISNITLKNNSAFTPVKKTLLLNMDDLGIYTDNIEGVTFGPDLPNGHKTLLFIADNNFNKTQQSQILLFEINE